MYRLGHVLLLDWRPVIKRATVRDKLLPLLRIAHFFALCRPLEVDLALLIRLVDLTVNVDKCRVSGLLVDQSSLLCKTNGLDSTIDLQLIGLVLEPQFALANPFLNDSRVDALVGDRIHRRHHLLHLYRLALH